MSYSRLPFSRKLCVGGGRSPLLWGVFAGARAETDPWRKREILSRSKLRQLRPRPGRQQRHLQHDEGGVLGGLCERRRRAPRHCDDNQGGR